MSMYELVFGSEGPRKRGGLLLGVLGNPNVGRFRDAWVERAENGELVIVIYTRNGGGNREEYADVIAALQAHPLYLRDADDDFDCTYATFYFRCPDSPPQLVEALRQVAVDPVNTSQRWIDAIKALEGETDG